MGALVLAAIVLILAAFAAAAMLWGVDSRDGSTDPRRPARPVGITSR